MSHVSNSHVWELLIPLRNQYAAAAIGAPMIAPSKSSTM